MSFLYKALLKDQGKQSQQANQDQQGQNQNYTNQASHAAAYNNQYAYSEISDPRFANQNNRPWLAWSAIAFLLLIIGLLAGYILGTEKVSPQIKVGSHILEAERSQTELVGANANGKGADQPSSEQTNPNVTYNDVKHDGTAESKQPLESVTAQSLPQEQQVVNVSTPAESSLNQSATNNLNVANVTENLTDSVDENIVEDEPQVVINVADINSSNITLDEVPSDLQAKFALALEETDTENNKGLKGETSNDNRIQVEVDSSLVDIKELKGSDKALIPELLYEMHIYSSDVNERWVRINNITLFEGDRLTPYLRVAEIRQDLIVWESRDRRFIQVALEDYR
ncbi:general secretion pathway protein GspB [Psychrosphaera aestuarii]|uniref:general secretion pathway protein GspB n=1 Tax=Psychrosphaera aestuarii TaxID=1266052 RepID=UPI001B324711|nr:general secretion pathway protein GspB [Psychrosphaera aestuarii]